MKSFLFCVVLIVSARTIAEEEPVKPSAKSTDLSFGDWINNGLRAAVKPSPPAATESAEKSASEKPATKGAGNPQAESDPQKGGVITDEQKAKAALKELGFTLIGESKFAYKDIQLKEQLPGFLTITGIIVNAGPKMRVGSFSVNLFDKDDKIVDSTPFLISGLDNSAPKAFKTITQADSSKVVKYAVQLNSAH